MPLLKNERIEIHCVCADSQTGELLGEPVHEGFTSEDEWSRKQDTPNEYFTLQRIESGFGTEELVALRVVWVDTPQPLVQLIKVKPSMSPN
jgi:hypothetical protein